MLSTTIAWLSNYVLLQRSANAMKDITISQTMHEIINISIQLRFNNSKLNIILKGPILRATKLYCPLIEFLHVIIIRKYNNDKN